MVVIVTFRSRGRYCGNGSFVILNKGALSDFERYSRITDSINCGVNAADSHYFVAFFESCLLGCKLFALFLLRADQYNPEDDKHKYHHD